MQEVGAIDNGVSRGFGAPDTLAASVRLRRLHDLGLIERKVAASCSYSVSGPAMHRRQSPDDETHMVGGIPHPAGAATHNPVRETHNPPGETHKLGVELGDVPEALRVRVAAAGARPRQFIVRSLVLALCAWRPLSAREIAALLGGHGARDPTRSDLRRLLDAGDLAYTIPQMLNHPQQRYRLPKSYAESP